MYKFYKEEIHESVSLFIFQETFNKKYNLHLPDSCKKCGNFIIKLKYEDNDEKKKS